ncbi:MAG: DUF4097 family beta strand repeat protein [Clostridia bacterium]|nr:DUF4097 family beta strand repeat protein [Clostridia bacterium]
MKRFLHIILFILILSLAATGCVRITVTMPDEAQKQEVKDNLTAAKESVKEAVESIPGKMESAGEDIVKAIEDALPSSIESISTGSAVIDPSLIDEIDIDWVSGSVTISVWEGSSIRISETSDTELTEKEQLRWKIEERELKIRPCAAGTNIRILSQNAFPEKALTVEIPASMALKELGISQVSSVLNAENVKADEIDIETVSGTALLSGITASKLDIETVSGEIRFTDLTVLKKISAETVSGDIKIELSDSVPGFTLKPESLSALITVPQGAEIVGKTYQYGDGSVRIEYSSVSGSLQIS